jgi:hypothetical protein
MVELCTLLGGHKVLQIGFVRYIDKERLKMGTQFWKQMLNHIYPGSLHDLVQAKSHQLVGEMRVDDTRDTGKPEGPGVGMWYGGYIRHVRGQISLSIHRIHAAIMPVYGPEALTITPHAKLPPTDGHFRRIRSAMIKTNECIVTREEEMWALGVAVIWRRSGDGVTFRGKHTVVA